jgi:hypothetical protein
MPANVVSCTIEKHLFGNREISVQSQVKETNFAHKQFYPLTESRMFLFQQFTHRLQRICLRRRIHQPLDVDLTTQRGSRLWSWFLGSTSRLVYSMTKVHCRQSVFPISIGPIGL